MEHRQSPRKKIDARVTLTTRSGLLGSARIIDVSATGGRLDTELPLQVDSMIAVTLTARAARHPSRFKCDAQVVRHSNDGFGIEWMQFAPELLRTLYDHGPEVASLPG